MATAESNKEPSIILRIRYFRKVIRFDNDSYNPIISATIYITDISINIYIYIYNGTYKNLTFPMRVKSPDNRLNHR